MKQLNVLSRLNKVEAGSVDTYSRDAYKLVEEALEELGITDYDTVESVSGTIEDVVEKVLILVVKEDSSKLQKFLTALNKVVSAN